MTNSTTTSGESKDLGNLVPHNQEEWFAEHEPSDAETVDLDELSDEEDEDYDDSDVPEDEDVDYSDEDVPLEDAAKSLLATLSNGTRSPMLNAPGRLQTPLRMRSVSNRIGSITSPGLGPTTWETTPEAKLSGMLPTDGPMLQRRASLVPLIYKPDRLSIQSPLTTLGDSTMSPLSTSSSQSSASRTIGLSGLGSMSCLEWLQEQARVQGVNFLSGSKEAI